jgi:hypothetical protein
MVFILLCTISYYTFYISHKIQTETFTGIINMYKNIHRLHKNYETCTIFLNKTKYAFSIFNFETCSVKNIFLAQSFIN